MRGIGTVDYVIIVVYLAFILAIGPVYRRFSSTASDYFRGGGGMLWWMVGASAWVMTFSAWTFVGGAGKAYETGTFFLLLAAANFIGLLFTYLFTAARFRQMRIITPVEAVRKRFGPRNEQFFTWLPVPFGIIFGGIALYTIGLFMKVVFELPVPPEWELPLIIILLGMVVTFMSMAGGSWAVVASDFVQMLTILTITFVMAYLCLSAPEVGGLSGLIEKVPERHFDWTEFDRPWVIGVFFLGLLVSQTIMPNSIAEGAGKFIYVKSGKDAKRALLISMAGTLLVTPVFIIPAMAATIMLPDLAAQYPDMANPSEASYIAIAMRVLPNGMLGLLVCGIFAATMSSMDTGLNRSSGILVRNFYLAQINPQASEHRQVRLGQILTVVLGSLQIGTGLIFSRLEQLPLFDLVLLLSASLGLPMAVPLFFGIFVKRTPPWAGWSTVLVGFTSFLILNGGLGLPGLLRPENLQGILWFADLNVSELADLRVALMTLCNFTLCLSWFLGTMFFWKKSNSLYRERVDAFFEEMRTPIDPLAEGTLTPAEDRRQYFVIGTLCMAYGGFILLLALLPNPLWGRLCFVFCGGTIGGLGLVLYMISRHPRFATEVPAEVHDPEAKRPTVHPGICEVAGQPPRVLPTTATALEPDLHTGTP